MPPRKKPHDITTMLRRIARAVEPYPKAAMFELAERGFATPFQQLAFHRPKAKQIRSIARHVVKEWGGELPCDFEMLTSLPGVGPKCANLTLGIACGQPSISVDVHVHRVTNRWGYVAATSPEKTLAPCNRDCPNVTGSG